MLGCQPVPGQVLFVQRLHCSLRRDTFPRDVSKKSLANNTVSSRNKTVSWGPLGHFLLQSLKGNVSSKHTMFQGGDPQQLSLDPMCCWMTVLPGLCAPQVDASHPDRNGSGPK